MRKILFLILAIIIVLLGVFLIWNETTYDPLTSGQAKEIFKGFNGKYHKTKSEDLIGLSTHGDYYDIYLYHFDDVIISSAFPLIHQKWEKHQIDSNTIIGKWTKCPTDSLSAKLNKSLLEVLSKSKEQWLKKFTTELSNQDNYYSYLYFDEGNQYFFLFCPKNKRLYYIRKNGLY